MEDRKDDVKQAAVIDDAQIEAWASEAERGYDVDDLRRRGRRPIGETAGTVVSLRLEADLIRRLERRAAADRTTKSAVLRAALQQYVG
ncbi:ribbon-helix-helix protein, CopG family [Agrococcus terreus]|uniref:ribbon-helix-helix protein, CopG family n=1 Tax=Agrococcus terreus TaxID=574649 RepID=UPI00384FD1A7